MTDSLVRYSVTRRRFLRDATLTSLGLIAAACAPGTPGTTGGDGAAKGGEFHGGWPYKLPPEYHWNYFSTNAILGDSALYRDLFVPSLGVYIWAENKWTYWLAESAKLTGNDYEVKLRSGLKWDDGKPFTSKDVATTYWVGRIASFGIWNFIDKIETPDDLTVRFHYTKPSSLGERLILRNGIKPDSVYGALAKKAQDFYGGGGTNSTDAGKALIKEMNEFRPAGPPSVGPYKIDPSTLTAAQVTLVRNPGGLFADKVNFDKIVIYQGETQEITPVVLNGDIDYATHGFPLATDRAMQEKGFRIVRGPLFTGPALYFHWENAKEFQDKRLRQAVAMAFNRDEAGKIFYGSSARAPKYMAGFADSLVPNWVNSGDQGKLNEYKLDLGKADALMREAGYAKGGDGIYAKDGKKLEFELYFPSNFDDWAAAATYASDALNKFGIKIVLRGAIRSSQLPDTNAGKFQITMNPWGTPNAHPQPSLDRPFREFNKDAPGGGMKYPLTQQTSSGSVNFDSLLDDTITGFDTNKQKDPITKIALAFNELLPCIPIYERLGNNPINEKARVAGWKPEGDPIYTQGGADNFTGIMIMDGTLRKK
ncbi:MAG TPA: ABC transporter substrate-binding protein [Candidatus Limnocylindria bacterium]|jgi:peptide/nickel transport system substrate-binding protein|nr:ABC transporter substrate-binding protein [Candidatus Limnocylindria bacterium]